ncbi:MAG: exonuclease SbcCD subunit D [Clostridia bacterium]|nr:exonuclease SbcCD subunit D [Clostridia bacterium]
MRFLHLADLHLGKQLNDLSLLPDQEAVLDQIADIVRREETDAVLIAGDVYQRSSPQAEAMALFDRFISRLAEMGQRIFIISGNHDSPQRISYFSSLLKNAGVYVSEAFDGSLQRVEVTDAHGPLTVWLMPFLRPSQVRRFFPGEKLVTYQDAAEAILRAADVDFSRRNVLLCHQFITGSETCDSEERAVGGLDNIDARVFDGFDYVALGHIHKPQTVLRDTLRYAGSPLKYSFSESAHRKSVPVVDLGEKGSVTVRTVPLMPTHDLRRVEGTMDELTAMPYSEDYVWVTVRDELVPPDARVTLSVTFPNMMKYSVVNSHTRYDMDVQAAQSVEDKSVSELFTDFYRLQNGDTAPGEKHLEIIGRLLREMEETR